MQTAAGADPTVLDLFKALPASIAQPPGQRAASPFYELVHSQNTQDLATAAFAVKSTPVPPRQETPPPPPADGQGEPAAKRPCLSAAVLPEERRPPPDTPVVNPLEDHSDTNEGEVVDHDMTDADGVGGAPPGF